MRELDIFAEMLRHMVEGSMFHLQMVQYFSYLGLSGFAKLQKKRFVEENRQMVALQKFVVETIGMIPDAGAVEAKTYIPAEWLDKKRETAADRPMEEYVRYALETWRDWEQKTTELYSRCYYALEDLRAGFLADKAMEFVRGTGYEEKFAYNLVCWMRETDYDKLAIVQMDRDVVRKYDTFMKGVRKSEHNSK